MINETLSAYLDGEAAPHEIEQSLLRLHNDAAARRGFSQQHWVRQALRQCAHDRHTPPLDTEFSARVLAALDGDAVQTDVAARQQDAGTPEHARPGVVALARRPATGAGARWGSRAAGLAVAASAVVAALLLLGPQVEWPGVGSTTAPRLAATAQPVSDSTAQNPDTGRAFVSSAAPTTALQTQAQDYAQGQAQAQARTVAARTQPAASRPADHWSVSDPAVADQLNGYLLEHDGLARGYGLTSATPSLVRMATYRQGRGGQ